MEYGDRFVDTAYRKQLRALIEYRYLGQQLQNLIQRSATGAYTILLLLLLLLLLYDILIYYIIMNGRN